MIATRKRQTTPGRADADPVAVVVGSEGRNGLADAPDESAAGTVAGNAERVARQAATVGPVDTRSLLCATIAATLPRLQSAT